MSTALAVVSAKDLLTQQDLDILRDSKFRGFEPHEIQYCARISNSLALNPLLNQIHFVKRKNKDGTYSIAAQVGIDGFRLGAQRSGEYAGSDDPVFEYADKNKRPIKATVSVYRMISGQRCAFTASVRWEEFYNPIGGQWDRMPHVMLGKCAEAQALRKAFPAELSNIYAPEEMDQSDKPDKAAVVQSQVSGKAEAIEAESRQIEEEEPRPDGCPECHSTNVMASKWNEGQMYCRACKHKYPKAEQ